jgi:hypothetical protein
MYVSYVSNFKYLSFILVQGKILTLLEKIGPAYLQEDFIPHCAMAGRPGSLISWFKDDFLVPGDVKVHFVVLPLFSNNILYVLTL